MRIKDAWFKYHHKLYIPAKTLNDNSAIKIQMSYSFLMSIVNELVIVFTNNIFIFIWTHNNKDGTSIIITIK